MTGFTKLVLGLGILFACVVSVVHSYTAPCSTAGAEGDPVCSNACEDIYGASVWAAATYMFSCCNSDNECLCCEQPTNLHSAAAGGGSYATTCAEAADGPGCPCNCHTIDLSATAASCPTMKSGFDFLRRNNLTRLLKPNYPAEL